MFVFGTEQFVAYPTKAPSGIQTVLNYGKHLELSIVLNEMSYGGNAGFFEIMLTANGEPYPMKGITNDDGVKGFLTHKQVEVIISKVYFATGFEPEQKRKSHAYDLDYLH